MAAMDHLPVAVPPEKTTGFVGVGRMGANMARRLHDQGFTITAVYDVHAESARALADELHTTAAASLRDVSAAARTIVTVVSDDAAMRAIFDVGNADSLLAPSVTEGRLFINCATVSPMIHHAVQSAAQLGGAQTLEACMASSITQAREGTLYLMCGGERGGLRTRAPVLEALSSGALRRRQRARPPRSKRWSIWS